MSGLKLTTAEPTPGEVRRGRRSNSSGIPNSLWPEKHPCASWHHHCHSYVGVALQPFVTRFPVPPAVY